MAFTVLFTAGAQGLFLVLCSQWPLTVLSEDNIYPLGRAPVQAPSSTTVPPSSGSLWKRLPRAMQQGPGRAGGRGQCLCFAEGGMGLSSSTPRHPQCNPRPTNK